MYSSLETKKRVATSFFLFLIRNTFGRKARKSLQFGQALIAFSPHNLPIYCLWQTNNSTCFSKSNGGLCCFILSFEKKDLASNVSISYSFEMEEHDKQFFSKASIIIIIIIILIIIIVSFISFAIRNTYNMNLIELVHR